MYPSQGTCQALAIFEKKEKEKERLAKEKAEREEREGPTSTGIMVAFIIIKWLKDCFKNKKKCLHQIGFPGEGDASDPICLSSSPVPQEVRAFFKMRVNFDINFCELLCIS